MSNSITEEWMGEPVKTLADLLRPGLLAVCVGINPSKVSVERGHYYQGRNGQRFYERLRSVGLLPRDAEGFEDDALFARGVGFTDIIKRPTARATELRGEEYRRGREELRAKLDELAPELVIFTYKKTAEKLFGHRFAGNGFIVDPERPDQTVFVMPGPFESNETAKPTLRELAAWVREHAP